MKSLAVLSIMCMLCYSSVSAQQITIEKDSLNKIIQSTINEMIKEKSYTRIPNTQFDDIMVEKISSTIDDKFQKLYWYVFVIGAILGTLLFYSGNRFLKDSVQNKFTEESEVIQKKLSTEINKDVNVIKLELEQKLKEVNIKLENANSQFTDAKKEILFIRLEKIQNEVDSEKVAQETFQSLKKSLKESENLIDNSLTEKIILLLSKASYYLRKEIEMEKVVQTYLQNENITMNPSVFLNLASGFFYNYYVTSDNADKSKIIFYLNEALKQLPDYGEAFGLKLELLMLEYMRTTHETTQQEITHEAKQVLELIKSSSISSKDVIVRFERVGISKAEGDCISRIKELFPNEWKEIETIAKI